MAALASNRAFSSSISQQGVELLDYALHSEDRLGWLWQDHKNVLFSTESFAAWRFYSIARCNLQFAVVLGMDNWPLHQW